MRAFTIVFLLAFSSAATAAAVGIVIHALSAPEPFDAMHTAVLVVGTLATGVVGLAGWRALFITLLRRGGDR